MIRLAEWARILFGSLALLAAVGVLAGCGGGEEPAAPEEEAAPADETPVKAPEPERAPPPPPPAPPTTGTLQIEGTDGASVILDGRVLGTVPGAWEDLDAGEYPVRVEKEGFHSLEVSVTIRGGRTRSLAATLAEMLGSIVVESDIAGANVFIDRNFKGNTPVTIADLQPGEYNLTVSTEGHDIVSPSGGGRKESRAGASGVRRLGGVTRGQGGRGAQTSVRDPAKGRSVATPEGFDYQTDHKDAFQLPFAQAERFELDYLNNNLRVKVLGGRTYNFESPSEDMDSLFVFHRDVLAFREQG